MDNGGMGWGGWVAIAICILSIVGTWKVFTKAGRPGWASIIPIYNLFVLVDMAGKPWWWALVILLVPIVGVPIMLIIASIALAERFGKGTLYGVGIAFLGFIFLALLGFDDSTYSPAAGT